MTRVSRAYILSLTFASTLALVLPAHAQDTVSVAPDGAVPLQAAPSDGAGAQGVPPAPPGMTASQQTVPPQSAAVTAQAAAPGDVIAALPAGDAAGMAAMSPVEKEINEQLAALPARIDVNSMKSLFFSVWEHDLILDARRGLNTRAPDTDDGLGPESGPRDIALGGIVYHASGNWTIWLNSVRVSPTAIPEEVLDLKVFKDYIELEWFDEATNQVYPIRLRPHQRFNLDSRIFLPG